MLDDMNKKDTTIVTGDMPEEVITEQPVAETTPIKKNEPAKEPDVVDVDLGFVEKRRFRINGDYNRMLELNVSDLNITTRLKTGYPKLKALLAEAQEKIEGISVDGDDETVLGNMADALTDIDNKMRKIIDEIFDTNASEVCAPSGNMFDPVGGQYRFERIIETLSTLYANGLDNEFKQIKNRVEKKTSKYIRNKK